MMRRERGRLTSGLRCLAHEGPPAHSASLGRHDRDAVWRRCCMNTRCGWGGVARPSRDPPQEPHYGDEVEGSSQV